MNLAKFCADDLVFHSPNALSGGVSRPLLRRCFKGVLSQLTRYIGRLGLLAILLP